MIASDDTTTLPACRLRQQLAEIAEAEGLSSYTIETESDNNPAGGFMSNMRAVTLVGDRKQPDGSVAPHRLALICKLQLNDPVPEQFDSTPVFEREVRTYNEILPAIRQFQLDKGIALNGDDADACAWLAYPKCYAAGNRTPDRDAVIVLEDLRPSGHVVWEKSRPLALANVRLLFAELGRLHGVSVAMREQRPDVYAEWERLPDIFAVMKETKAVQDFFASSFDRAIALLGDNARYGGLLRALQRDWSLINVQCMDLEAIGKGAVLVHGDCWQNNVMYAMEKDTLKSLKILDWQLTHISTPALDLTYFLFTCTDKTLRDQHLPELLRTYYSSFAGIMKRCGSDPEKLYTFADLEAQLKQFGVYGAMTAVCVLNIIVADKEKLVNFEQLARSAENEKEPAQLVTLTERTEELYKERLIGVLETAYDCGWLGDYANL